MPDRDVLGLDHVAIAVSDVDAAVAFYTTVLGARLLYRIGPIDARDMPAEPDGRDWTDAHVDVRDGRFELAALAFGASTTFLELVGYERPAPFGISPRNDEPGGRHVALRVADVRRVADAVREHGGDVLAGPVTLPEGPCAGLTFLYLRDPFGTYVELVEYDVLPFQAG